MPEDNLEAQLLTLGQDNERSFLHKLLFHAYHKGDSSNISYFPKFYPQRLAEFLSANPRFQTGYIGFALATLIASISASVVAPLSAYGKKATFREWLQQNLTTYREWTKENKTDYETWLNETVTAYDKWLLENQTAFHRWKVENNRTFRNYTQRYRDYERRNKTDYEQYQLAERSFDHEKSGQAIVRLLPAEKNIDAPCLPNQRDNQLAAILNGIELAIASSCQGSMECFLAESEVVLPMAAKLFAENYPLINEACAYYVARCLNMDTFQRNHSDMVGCDRVWYFSYTPPPGMPTYTPTNFTSPNNTAIVYVPPGYPTPSYPDNKFAEPVTYLAITLPIALALMLLASYYRNQTSGITAKIISFVTSFYQLETLGLAKQLKRAANVASVFSRSQKNGASAESAAKHLQYVPM